MALTSKHYLRNRIVLPVACIISSPSSPPFFNHCHATQVIDMLYRVFLFRAKSMLSAYQIRTFWKIERIIKVGPTRFKTLPGTRSHLAGHFQ